MYCHYYQAQIVKEKIWFVVGCLKAEDHLAFERATQQTPNFEFFVPPGKKNEFLRFINYMQQQGYVANLEEKPNRFSHD